MNQIFGSGEAEIEFGSPDFKLIRPGAYVRCAVTGEPIPLDELRYWDAERNEAYRDANTAAEAWKKAHQDKDA